MPEMDINAAANEVVALLRRNDARAAATRLQALHDGQSAVVQESLDRYISARAAAELEGLRRNGGVAAADAATVNPMLDRLGEATRPPRMPDAAETAALSQAQQYDVYGSIVAQRGNIAANDAMATQDRVVLGLRDENRTTEARGRGVTRVDQIVASNPSAGRAAGETLFLVQGSPGDPAALRAGVNAAEVRDTAVEFSLRQLQQQSREQAAPVPAPAQQQEAPAMGGR